MADNSPATAQRERKPVPERFKVAKGTLRFDQFMTHAIRVGGVGIILAVFGILFFILSQIIPLFQKASVESRDTTSTGDSSPAILGIDEWSELPFFYNLGTEVQFADLKGIRGTFSQPVKLPDGNTISAADYRAETQQVTLGTSDGQIGSFTVTYTPEFDGEQRTIIPSVESGTFFPLENSGVPITSVAYGATDKDKLFAALQDLGGVPHLTAVTLKQKRSLFGAGKITKDLELNLTDKLSGQPKKLLVTKDAGSILVILESGAIDYLFREGDDFVLRQTFSPFGDTPGTKLVNAYFLLGDVSIVTTADDGGIRTFSLFRPDGSDRRLWGQTKTFPPLANPASFFVASQRNKAFLTGSGKQVSLRYSTTGDIRWQKELPFEVHAAAIDGKFETIAFTDTTGNLHRYALHDPHPEAGWKAFFGKVWYEGFSEPKHEWQSTGGSDDFEVKLSMVPLIFGSFKGTAYALLFAIPISLLAAIYTSQFLNYKTKRIVKPTMEIMASLPSVVLGFLAALWLAPILETRVPSVLVIFLGLPTVALLFGWAWNKLPIEKRSLIPPGLEFLVFLPLLLVSSWIFWEIGPVLEKIFFVVKDPTTGTKTADFRLWWPTVTGTNFEQRNSLVVGFIMGFAVIPIIFTISEDALSNVPPSLLAASSALGASRWQVVRTVVFPIASAGIFSAIMIGVGRAVGETMIMVMATGNTPLTEWNIFSGMRTLSANIAVELPEAPQYSTHYRALFLGAFLLFILTFVLNTAAELLRQRLREKFKLV